MSLESRQSKGNLVPPELLVECLLLVSIGDRRSAGAQHLSGVQAEHRASSCGSRPSGGIPRSGYGGVHC